MISTRLIKIDGSEQLDFLKKQIRNIWTNIGAQTHK